MAGFSGRDAASTWEEAHKKRVFFYASAAVFAASFLIYSPTLLHTFAWDDTTVVGSIYKELGGYNIYRGGEAYFRPFMPILNKIDSILWHSNTHGYHLTNLLLNSFVCTLVFGLAFMLLGSMPAALTTAALFILHPAHADSVAWVSGRTDIVASLFFLLSLMTYIMFRQSGKYTGLALSSVFLLFSLLCKEIAVVLPITVFSYDRLIREEKGKDLIFPQIPLFLTIGIYALLRGGFSLGVHAARSATPAAPGTAYIVPSAAASAASPLIDSLKEIIYGFGFYVNKLLLPYDLTVFPDTRLAINLFFAALFFVVLAAAVVRRHRITVFALLFFMVLLAPTFFTMLMALIPATVAVRYLYLPVFGLCLAAGYAYTKIPRKAALAIVTALSLFYAAGLHPRNMEWKNSVTLFKHEVEKNPESAMAHMQNALVSISAKQYDMAEKEIDYLEANFEKLKCRKEIKGTFFTKIISTKGEIRLVKGDPEGAKFYFEKAGNLNPNIPGLNFILGEMAFGEYLKTADPSSIVKAQNYYEKEDAVMPNQAKINYALGRTNLLLGKKDKAIKYFSRVAEIDPDSSLAAPAVREVYKLRFGVDPAAGGALKRK